MAMFCLFLVSCSDGEGVDDLFGIDNDDDLFGPIGNTAISFTPNTHDFGPNPVNNNSSWQVIQLKNNSGATIYLNDVESSSTQFVVESLTCPTGGGAMGPQTTCNIRVRFSPTVAGDLNSSLIARFGETSGAGNFQSISSLSGLSTTDLIFGGLDSIDNLLSTSLRLNWTDVANENGYAYFLVNGPILQFMGSTARDITSVSVSGLSPSTSYTFRVRAIDFYGNYENNTNDVTITTPPPLTLAQIPDRLFTAAAGPLVESVSYAVDANNSLTGADFGISYTCYFDTVVDGSVAAATLCSSSPDFVLDAGFVNNGQLTLSPSRTMLGQSYEVRITGDDGGTQGDEIFVVNVSTNYPRSNLVLDYQADFANGGTAPGQNVPLTTTFSNLIPSGSSEDGNLSSGTFASGWQGDGTPITNLHRLYFDGNSGATADRVLAGTGLNSLATPMFSAWIRPRDLSAGDAIVFGNGGNGSDGWALKQNASGGFEFSVGSTTGGSPATALAALNPVIWLRMDETAGTTAVNSGSLAQNASLEGAGNISINQAGAYGISRAYDIQNGGYLRFDPVVDISDTYTIMAWIRFPLNHHTSWKTLVRGNSHHALLFQENTNILGSYSGGFRSSTFDSDTLPAGWHHVAVVANGTNATFYVDGAAVGVPVTTIVQDEIYAVGNYQAGGSAQSIGFFDDFAYFPTALTQPQIQSVYDGGCSASLTENEWAHIGGYFDGTDSYILVNGSPVCDVTATGNITGSLENFSVGAKADGTLAWEGEIAQLSIYSSGGAAEIANHYGADSLRYLYPSSCQEWYNAGFTTDGVYTIRNSGTGLNHQVYCDQTTDGGGWMLVLNYLHQGNTNPATDPNTTDFPRIVSSTLGNNESSNAAAWGHAAPSLLNNFTFTNIRFYCITGAHARILDFKTTSSNCISYFKSGTGQCNDLSTTSTNLPGHTANLPANQNNSFSNRGNDAMTNFPFYLSSSAHWGIRGNGNRWECDDQPNDDDENTLHRIWVK